jgi:anti-sigma factor RsiW
MSFDPNDPRITSYLLDELDGEERAAFESQMAASDELRQAIADTHR